MNAELFVERLIFALEALLENGTSELADSGTDIATMLRTHVPVVQGPRRSANPATAYAKPPVHVLPRRRTDRNV